MLLFIASVSQTRYNRAPSIQADIKLNAKLKKKFRAIGHHLNPALTVGDNGLADSVVAELNRALDDHELIKVKIVGDRNERAEIIQELPQLEATEIVHTIGSFALIYRPARKPIPPCQISFELSCFRCAGFPESRTQPGLPASLH